MFTNLVNLVCLFSLLHSVSKLSCITCIVRSIQNYRHEICIHGKQTIGTSIPSFKVLDTYTAIQTITQQLL